MPQDQQDLLTEDYVDRNAKTRKQLLPWWIKVFMWIFLLGGVFGVLIAVPVVYLLKGVTSFGLITQKNWAIKIGLVDASLCIFLCLIAMIYPLLNGHFNFSLRLELALLVPYLLRLLRIRVEWENALPG